MVITGDVFLGLLVFLGHGLHVSVMVLLDKELTPKKIYYLNSSQFKTNIKELGTIQIIIFKKIGF